MLSDASNGANSKFVKSSSGHAASPEDIIKSCRALQTHIGKSTEDAKQQIKQWEEEIKERDLAEKRRVAPGWLDREEKILQPSRANVQQGNQDLLGEQSSGVNAPVMSPSREGEELDRVFGKMGMK